MVLNWRDQMHSHFLNCTRTFCNYIIIISCLSASLLYFGFNIFEKSDLDIQNDECQQLHNVLYNTSLVLGIIIIFFAPAINYPTGFHTGIWRSDYAVPIQFIFTVAFSSVINEMTHHMSKEGKDNCGAVAPNTILVAQLWILMSWLCIAVLACIFLNVVYNLIKYARAGSDGRERLELRRLMDQHSELQGYQRLYQKRFDQIEQILYPRLYQQRIMNQDPYRFQEPLLNQNQNQNNNQNADQLQIVIN